MNYPITELVTRTCFSKDVMNKLGTFVNKEVSGRQEIRRIRPNGDSNENECCAEYLVRNDVTDEGMNEVKKTKIECRYCN